jgi:hypothetical protein
LTRFKTKATSFRTIEKRRHPDSNWGIKDLQSSALPLGYAAATETVFSIYAFLEMKKKISDILL